MVSFGVWRLLGAVGLNFRFGVSLSVRVGASLEASLAGHGASWAVLAVSLAVVGVSWAVLDPSWVFFGPSST
eukprot:5901224-Pyramimonas_sp.AAC.1